MRRVFADTHRFRWSEFSGKDRLEEAHPWAVAINSEPAAAEAPVPGRGDSGPIAAPLRFHAKLSGPAPLNGFSGHPDDPQPVEEPQETLGRPAALLTPTIARQPQLAANHLGGRASALGVASGLFPAGGVVRPRSHECSYGECGAAGGGWRGSIAAAGDKGRATQ